MLDNIRSKYILKFFLSHVNEKKKLNLVKYNKNLQTKININLLYYKILSGNYTTIYDNNNKIGIIFDEYRDKIIFEGEFSNGKKNGKGKEYDINTGKIKYEGEYFNGNVTGRGKVYYHEGNIKYQVEFKKGKKITKGKKIQFSEGPITKEGEYINEHVNGKAEVYDKYGTLIYEGEYINGQAWNGKGFIIE